MLSREQLQVVGRALSASGGREICGYLLLGVDGSAELYLIRNWVMESGSFFVSNSEADRAERHAARRGLRLSAFLHTHFSTLELSQEDAIGLESSTIPWIIVMPGGSGMKQRVYPPGNPGAGMMN